MKSSMKCHVLISLLVSLTFRGENLLYAQSEQTSSQVTGWINWSAGPSFDGGMAAVASFNVQHKQFVISMRHTGAIDGAGLLSFGLAGESYSDHALLFRLAAQQKWAHASLATDIARFKRTQITFFDGETVKSGIGLPLEAQLMIKVLPFAGIGATVFGNLNSDKSFGGFTLGLQIGKLR